MGGDDEGMRVMAQGKVIDTINKLPAATSRALWVSASTVQTGAVPVENRDSGPVPLCDVAVAQLDERRVSTSEDEGSSPSSDTNMKRNSQ